MQTQAQEHYLITLTSIIDNINEEQHITSDYLHEKFWPGINQLRNDPERETLLREWKYSGDFNSTEESHKNEQKTCPLLEWEQSYTMFFYLCIYH